MDPPPPLQILAISGPTMSSLLHHFTTTPTSLISGLLFGNVTLTTQLNLSDDSSDTAPTLIATVTDFLATSSFFSSSGDINIATLRGLIPQSSSLLGWFSGRRRSAPRPSCREFSITSSLSSLSQFSSTIKLISNPNSNRFSSSSIYFNPCLFLLMSSPISDKKSHIHEHRVYQFITQSRSFNPISFDFDTDKFLVGELNKLVSYEANTQSLENLHVMIENLTTLVEQSSAKVLEQLLAVNCPESADKAKKQDLKVSAAKQVLAGSIMREIVLEELRSKQTSADKPKKQDIKAAEQVLAGSIRREMVLQELCSKQTSEIMQLNRLLQHYKHERECNAIITRRKEGEIRRLQSLLDGVLPSIMNKELVSLKHEHELLKENYEHHPEVLKMKIDLRRVQDELQEYQNFYEFGERGILMEEIYSLRDQLLFSIDYSSASARKEYPPLQLSHSYEPKVVANLTAIPDSTEASAEANENSEPSEDSAKVTLEQERSQRTEAESRWISLSEQLRAAVEANRLLAEKSKCELDAERKCSKELKDALQVAMESNARTLDQYANLEEEHIRLLEKHRKIHDGKQQ